MNVYEFRVIDRYPHYLFSSCGKVFSTYTNKFLKQQKTPNGYMHVVLVEKKEKQRLSVHRLIATAFHGHPLCGQVINHINSIRHDNRAENIEWVSQSQNVKHAYTNGRRTINEKHRINCSLLGMKKRKTSIYQEQEIMKMYSGRRGDIERISKAFGFSRDVISRVVNGGL